MDTDIDALVVGGAATGLSAALVLGRAQLAVDALHVLAPMVPREHLAAGLGIDEGSLHRA